MTYRLIEGCAGTAALTLHLCGFTKPLLAYQGSKWRYRKELEEILIQNSFSGPPSSVELYDVGPWCSVIETLVKNKSDVVSLLKEYLEIDPKKLFDLLQNKNTPTNEVGFAAEFLFLQRLAYSGKAVGSSSGKWKSPGFNITSAYGLAATDKFGKINPVLPSLIKIIEESDFSTIPLTPHGSVPKSGVKIQRTAIYLDPPYQGTTKYPDGFLKRDDLVKIALGWNDAGAFVMVSEAKPISELTDLGWQSICISAIKKNKSPFKSKKEEYVTINCR